jgi:hypothetical protein
MASRRVAAVLRRRVVVAASLGHVAVATRSPACGNPLRG